MTENKLVEISIEDLPKLRDLYKDRKTEASSYNTIQNYIEWFEKDPSIDFARFYSLNGDWSDGTFVLKDSYLLLFDTLHRAGGAVNRLKDSLCLFDYSEWRVFNGYDSRLQGVVEEVVERLSLNDRHWLNGSYDLYVFFRGFANNLVERPIADNLSLAALREDHAEQIDNIWDFRHEGSLNATRNLIKYGTSLGAFTSDDRLVGWIIVQQTGALGLLKVHEDFRRLGIASALITSIAKKMSASGQDVMTLISPENHISKSLFEAIGFRRTKEYRMNWTFEANNIISFNTLKDPEDRLLTALNCLDIKAPYISGFVDRLLPAVRKYVEQLGDRQSEPVMTIWYHIPKESALAFNTEPPEGITVSSLRQEDVHTVNSIWPHRFPGSEALVGRLISLNLSAGAYDKDGTLLAWILKLPVGSLGILHVKDEYKRRGLGSLMVRVLSKKFAELGIEVTAPVVHVNTPSRSMFKSLNFTEIDKVYWWSK